MADECPPLDVLLAAEDGDLPGEDRARVLAHRDACAPCRAALADLDALVAAGGALLEAEYDAAVTSTTEERCARLIARLEWEVTTRPVVRPAWPRRWLWAAALLALVAGGIVSRTSAAEVVYQIVSVVRAFWWDLARPSPPPGAQAPASVREPESRVPAALPPVPAEDAPDLVALELQARVLARAADADLSEDLRIWHTDRAVHVTGTVPATVIHSLTRQLRALGPVSVSVRSRRDPALSTSPDALRAWLDHHFARDAPERARFVPQLRARVMRTEGHLSALRTLATRYPRESVTPLSGQAAQALATLVAAHVRLLHRDLQGLDLQLASVPFAVAERCAASAAVPGDWRARATGGAPAAQALRMHVDRVVARPDVTEEDATAMAGAFSGVWETWYCDRP